MQILDMYNQVLYNYKNITKRLKQEFDNTKTNILLINIKIYGHIMSMVLLGISDESILINLRKSILAVMQNIS